MLERVAHDAARGRHWVGALSILVMSALVHPMVGAQEQANIAILEPMCQGIDDEAPCWRELSNKAGCHVWDADPATREMATFDGEIYTCTEGRLNARGKTTWNWYDANAGWRSLSGNGSYLDGKAGGPWVLEPADGIVERGPFVDGNRHGTWVIEWADGYVERGPFVNGQQSGTWVLERTDGGVESGPYVDGEKHGPWVIEYPDGDGRRGRYVNGQRHGTWVTEYAHGTVTRTRYENGKYMGVVDD